MDGFALANTKGGCGKTTLTFQLACAYAESTPDVKVLVLDATLNGDTSIMFLGGSQAVPGGDGNSMGSGLWYTQNLNASNCGTLTGVFRACLNGNASAPTWLSSLFTSSSTGLDLENKVFQVSRVNPAVPPNIYLACGGRDRVDLSERSARQRVVKALSDGIAAIPDRWSVFADTDGDLELSPYTKACLGICPKLVLPYELDSKDILRFSNFFLPQLREMNGAGERTGAVSMMLWNKVSVSKWGDAGLISPIFKSPKEKEADMQSLQESLAEWLLGDRSRWREVRSAVIPPFDSAGNVSSRSGAPLITSSDTSDKATNLRRVISHIVSMMKEDEMSAF